jgi:hypothetical protein
MRRDPDAFFELRVGCDPGCRAATAQSTPAGGSTKYLLKIARTMKERRAEARRQVDIALSYVDPVRGE